MPSPQIAAATPGGSRGSLASPTAQIAEGTGFVLSSDDQPMGLYQSGGLRIKFNIRNANSNTPNTADITIYSLAEGTAADLIQYNR